MIPSIFTNFVAYDQLGDWAGAIEELTTPKVASKMIEYHAGGMLGAIDIDVGVEKLETDITFGGIDERMFAMFANCDIKGSPVRFVGSYKKPDSCGYDSVEIQLLVKPKELDLGTFKKGENVPVKIGYTATYYMLTINNIPMIEIDMINNVRKAMGVDLNEGERTALGQ